MSIRHVSSGQVRKLMEELSKARQEGLAAMKAGMDRKTAGKYAGCPPKRKLHGNSDTPAAVDT